MLRSVRRAPLCLVAVLAAVALPAPGVEQDPATRNAGAVSDSGSRVDWSGFERGVELLAEGKPRKASRRFRRLDEPALEELGRIAENLALAYWRDPVLEPAEVIPFLKDAGRKARIEDLPPADYRRAIEIARAHLHRDAERTPLVRTLLCHFKFLGGERPSIDEEAVFYPTDPALNPEGLFALSPTYWPGALDTELPGEVVARLTFDRDGCVNTVEIDRGLTEKTDGLVRAVHQWWVVTPIERDGEAVPFVKHTLTRMVAGEDR